MRLCKHWDKEPGLTLCHCALLQPWAQPITPQPLGSEEQRVRPQYSGQAWDMASLSSI